MLLTDDQLDRYVGKGAECELILHSLIRSESNCCGIASYDIDWDFRTNVRDGGRDVLIRTGSKNAERKFIPNTASVWSSKSGREGLSVPVLRKEIQSHPKVLDHLKNGGAYVWCVFAAAKSQTRDSLRDAAVEIAEENGFSPEQIQFRFRDAITEWLNKHIGIACVFFDLPRGWRTLNEWKQRDKNFEVPWVSFGSRLQLLTTVQQHLLATSGSNVLHICGWSGVGKTRTVLEACLQEPALDGTIYFPTFEEFVLSEDYFIRHEHLRAVLVIDEVDLDKSNALRSRLAHFEGRLRIVTIGPALASDAAVPKEIIVFPSPHDEFGVEAVIRAADPEINRDHTSNIASFCGHDLRFALILVDANRRNPWLTDVPLLVADIWRIVLERFRNDIVNLDRFRELYDILSSCTDIGNQGNPRQELEYLARVFKKSITDFDQVIAQALACGLARQQGRYVEIQRGLARYRFATGTWPHLKSTVAEFVTGMPNLRMQERFLERAQELGGSVRDEVAARLITWFSKQFPVIQIYLLHERRSARVFAAYTELNPTFGLNWLRRAVDNATPEELVSFDGEPDGSGFWRGRRNIVWLCEHLAQFPEHFWTCEAILYRLALHENEVNVSNNSSGVWQRFFRPWFSWTAIPFEERFTYLLEKLNSANLTNYSIVMNAAMGAVFMPTGATALPTMVGGRPVPSEWRPATNHDLHDIRAASAARLIQCVKDATEPVAANLRSFIIDHLGTFLELGCLVQLQEWLIADSLDEDTLRKLRFNLDEYVNLMRVRSEGSDWLDVHPSDYEKNHAQTLLSGALEWQRLLEPQDLAARIKNVTSKYFGQHNSFSQDSSTKTERLYENLALEAIENPVVVDQLVDWFDSTDAKSAADFGRVLGRKDDAFRLLPTIINSLLQGRATEIVGGYFLGIRTLFGFLPRPLSETLDSVGESHPRPIIDITLACDASDAGLRRLFLLIPRLGANASQYLRLLGYGHWQSVLDDEKRAQAIELLLQLGREGDAYAYGIALDLILHWGHQEWSELPTGVAAPAIEVLEESLNGVHHFMANEWLHAIRKMPTAYEQRKLDLLAYAATQSRLPLRITEGAVNLLSNLAPKAGDAVMSAIGKWAIDRETRSAFFFMNFLGLFEAIGVEVVRAWVNQVGIEGARAIARHVLSPMISPTGAINIPPLTAWLLEAFEEDDSVFEEFCAGRHAGEFYMGSLSARFEGTEESMQPYLTHRLRRVREWAQYEIETAVFMRGLDLQRQAEFGRV